MGLGDPVIFDQPDLTIQCLGPDVFFREPRDIVRH